MVENFDECAGALDCAVEEEGFACSIALCSAVGGEVGEAVYSAGLFTVMAVYAISFQADMSVVHV